MPKDNDLIKHFTDDSKDNLRQDSLSELVGAPIFKKPSNKSSRWFGLMVLIIFFGGLSLWSTLAPIESAAIAQGKVTVTGNRRTIQHLEGGIIKKIYIKDGSEVKKGQLLIQLEDTRSKAAYELTQIEAYQLMAIESRLIAERDNSSHVMYPKTLLNDEKTDAKLKSVLSAQQDIFTANLKSFNGNTEILRQQILQLKEQIKGVQSQLVSNTRQYQLIQEEIIAVSHLEKKKLIEKPKLLELQRAEARLQGSRGENISNIAVLKQKIGEASTKILTLAADRRKEILTTLRDSQHKLSNTLKKQIVEKDIFERTQIRAPQNGNIVALNVHTIGGVVKPGEPLMDIVPDEQLIIEAQVSPLDIDIVHKGLTAKIQLVAFKTRNTPALLGHVIYISADAYTNEQTGETYYQAKIELNKKELAKLTQEQELYPGMPVQAMIITEKRTFFNYVVTPVLDSFHRAFREQ